MEDDAFEPFQSGEIRGKKILIAPLNWGLGHVTRCIPIVREALRLGAEVTLASDGGALALLKKEFPQLTALKLPAYNIRYFSASMILNMSFQWHKIPLAVWRERRFLKRYLKNNRVDAVISDNRYGVYDRKIKSVILTHQLFIRASPRPLQRALNAVNHFLIRRFNECWVPDEAGGVNLSGELSHGPLAGVPVKFIGALSRMTRYPAPKIYDLGVVLSGPEPQRGILEKLILRQLEEINDRAAVYLLVRGVASEAAGRTQSGNIEIYNYLTSKALNDKMLSCRLVLCRSGYSGVMDLAALGVNAVLIPTPGQTEQEYLAARLSAAGVFYSQPQSELNIGEALAKSRDFKGLSWRAETPSLLTPFIASLFGAKAAE